MIAEFAWTVEHILGPDWSITDANDRWEFPTGAINRFLWELGLIWYKVWLHVPICVSRNHCLACRKIEPGLACHHHTPLEYWRMNHDS